LSKLASSLNLSISETTIFVLLAAFSLLAAYGYGRLALDVLYIYCFPFILMYFAFKWLIKGLIAINRLFEAGTSLEGNLPATSTETLNTVFAVAEPNQKGRIHLSWKGIGRALTRPLRRFTLLWCLLLLFTTHVHLLQLALIIVVIHIAIFLVTVLRVILFSTNVLANLGERMMHKTEELLARVLSVTPDTEATAELRDTWTRISSIQIGVMILRNKKRVSRWTAILGAACLVGLYLYLALLFSFAYYGAARVQSINLTWGSTLVTSLFMPFAFSDLPSNVWLKLTAGTHCLVIVAVGAGTVINYLTRRAEDLETAAIALIERFEDENVRTRLEILNEKFGTPKRHGAHQSDV